MLYLLFIFVSQWDSQLRIEMTICFFCYHCDSVRGPIFNINRPSPPHPPPYPRLRRRLVLYSHFTYWYTQCLLLFALPWFVVLDTHILLPSTILSLLPEVKRFVCTHKRCASTCWSLLCGYHRSNSRCAYLFKGHWPWLRWSCKQIRGNVDNVHFEFYTYSMFYMYRLGISYSPLVVESWRLTWALTQSKESEFYIPV